MLDPLTYKLPPHMPINNKSRSSSEPFDWARETREIAKDQKRTMRGSNAYKMMDMTDDLLDRRIKATIAFGNEAVKRYKDYPALVDSQQDSAAYNWIILNLSAGNTYNMIESKYYLLCGAAIWILDRITEIPGWRQKLYPLLPQDISLLEGLNLPDLWDAKYEYELIMSVVYILYHRNDDIAPVESIGRRLTNVFTNSFLAKDKEPANAPCKAAYRELISLIPSSAIEDAIKTYVSLFWEWTDRYFLCASLISKEIKAKQDERIQIIEKYNKKRDEVLRLQEKLKKENRQKRSSPKGSSYNALLMKPFPAAPSINADLGLESNPAGGTIDLNRVLSSQQRLDDPNRRFANNSSSYLTLPEDVTLLGYDFAPAADPAKLLEQTYTETSAAVSGIYVKSDQDFTALFTYVAGDGTKLEKTLNVEVRADADTIPTLYSTNSAATYSRPTPSVTSGKITSIQQVSGTWLIWFNGEDAYCCDNGKNGRPAGCPTYHYTHTSTVDATQYVPGDHYGNQMRIWGGLDQLSMGLLTVRESDDFSAEFCARNSSTYSASDAAVLEYAARIYNEQQLYIIEHYPSSQAAQIYLSSARAAMGLSSGAATYDVAG